MASWMSSTAYCRESCTRSWTEVLEAQQQLYPAQNTLAQIRRDRLLAHVQPYEALGGGWNLTDAEWEAEKKGK